MSIGAVDTQAKEEDQAAPKPLNALDVDKPSNKELNESSPSVSVAASGPSKQVGEDAVMKGPERIDVVQDYQRRIQKYCDDIISRINGTSPEVIKDAARNQLRTTFSLLKERNIWSVALQINLSDLHRIYTKETYERDKRLPRRSRSTHEDSSPLSHRWSIFSYMRVSLSSNPSVPTA